MKRSHYILRLVLIVVAIADCKPRNLIGDNANSASFCGDGTLDPQGGETCDDGNTITEACPYGATSCEVCDAGCQLSAGLISYCGDGQVRRADGEECDDGNTVTEVCVYGERSCEVCRGDCQRVVGATSYCGDGAVDAASGEACDDGNVTTEACLYGATSCEICDAGCQLSAGATSYCGDGEVRGVDGETCDDGNATTEQCDYGVQSCQVCSSSCDIVVGQTSFCGDGTIDQAAGEACDDGNKLTELCVYGQLSCEVCDGVCEIVTGQTSYCGDGMRVFGEACDDGVANSDSVAGACPTNCSGCGDAVVDVAAGEVCDDGNQVDNDACLSTCFYPICNSVAVDLSTDKLNCGGCGRACPDYFSCVDSRCGAGSIKTYWMELPEAGGPKDIAAGFGRVAVLLWWDWWDLFSTGPISILASADIADVRDHNGVRVYPPLYVDLVLANTLVLTAGGVYFAGLEGGFTGLFGSRFDQIPALKPLQYASFEAWPPAQATQLLATGHVWRMGADGQVLYWLEGGAAGPVCMLRSFDLTTSVASVLLTDVGCTTQFEVSSGSLFWIERSTAELVEYRIAPATRTTALAGLISPTGLSVTASAAYVAQAGPSNGSLPDGSIIALDRTLGSVELLVSQEQEPTRVHANDTHLYWSSIDPTRSSFKQRFWGMRLLGGTNPVDMDPRVAPAKIASDGPYVFSNNTMEIRRNEAP